MKKIGILTYFRGDNPGSFLQTYAMLHSLQSRFPHCHVEVIDCGDFSDLFQFRKGHLKVPSLIREYKRYRVYRECKRRYLRKSPTGITTTDYAKAIEFIEKNDYDLIVVGSDTVLDLFSSYGLTDPGRKLAYWLSLRIRARKVIYSASAGAVTYDRIDGGLRSRLSELINDFDLIAVRDEMSYNLIQALGLKDSAKLEMTPDPTFAFDINYKHIEKVLARKRIDVSRPIIGFGPQNLRHPVCKEIASYYRRKGFQIASIQSGGFGDYRFDVLSPFEWAGVFRYFTLTVTNSFHTTIFSLKNGVPVVSLDANERRIAPGGLSKLYCLLKLFALHRSNYVRLAQVDDPRQVVQITDSAMSGFDPQGVKEKAEQLRENFLGFLNKIDSLLA